MIEILPVTNENIEALSLQNEPFSMPGRLVVGLENGSWTYSEELFSEPETMTFPQEAYTLDSAELFLSAYEDGQCVGLAVFEKRMFRYLYLADLKVCAHARGKGIGKKLIQQGLKYAVQNGYEGIYVVAQDNNLNACRFYLAQGFQIGGFDNRVYSGTSQKGKADIYFYLKGIREDEY